MKQYLAFLLAGVAFAACTNSEHKNTQNTSIQKKEMAAATCSPSAVFNKKDSTGTIRGPVLSFDDTSISSASGDITIKDKAGDSIPIFFHYSEAKNVDLKKLVIGNCVEIFYRAEIIREEGIESNRIFFITDIKYQ